MLQSLHTLTPEQALQCLSNEPLSVTLPFYQNTVVDISEFINSIQANLNEVNQLVSMRDPSLHLLDWTVSCQGYTIIGGDSRIQRVIRAHGVHFEDKEVVEHLFDSADYEDLSANGDDDFV